MGTFGVVFAMHNEHNIIKYRIGCIDTSWLSTNTLKKIESTAQCVRKTCIPEIRGKNYKKACFYPNISVMNEGNFGESLRLNYGHFIESIALEIVHISRMPT